MTIHAPTRLILPAAALLAPGLASAAESSNHLDLTNHWVGYVSILLFVGAYLMVMAEEFTHLRKSKPVILAAGIIWALIAYVYVQHGMPTAAEEAVRHNIMEYGELFLFLLVAMTYVNVMDERNVFEALRSWLVGRGLGYRQLFWLTGILAFFISSVLDNLTTALLMSAVILSVGADSPKFVVLAFINLVVAANAGGAFCPFGDITTLMVWQKGLIDFWGFFQLFIPSVVNFVIPAAIMHFAVPAEVPRPREDKARMRRGAKRAMLLFFLTIVTAVSFHNFLHLPPVLGMMTGLAYLKLFAYYLKKTGEKTQFRDENLEDPLPFDIYRKLARAEWDTLMFFYGVVLCVGGLGFIGYLALVSQFVYVDMGPTTANVLIGILSAFVDNIPVMFAVLNMAPAMSDGQWLLVTLTAGVGGSMLSIGSAAGVALMGQSKGMYTFFSHLKWTPAIALGYAASIYVHMLINADIF
ncbi:MAG: sodium:proton antiporter NhaD [Chromatiaceae bacterium]|nr:sodium:proton antiporter NhaD [Chromatiaceae bacterium]